MWSPGTLEDRVHDCDVIVVGILDAVTIRESCGLYYDEHVRTECGVGTISVERVVWGEVTSDELTLEWEDPVDVGCVPFCQHQRHQGERGIWLLTRGEGAVFHAENTAWFVPLAHLAEVEEHLSSRPVCLHQKEWRLFAGSLFEVSFIFRNATGEPVEIPRFDLAGNFIILDEGVALTVDYAPPRGDWQVLPPPAGRVEAIAANITIAPRTEHRVDLDLAEFYPMDREGAYRVSFSVGDHAPANEVQWRFYDEPPPVHQHVWRTIMWISGLVLGSVVLLFLMRTVLARKRAG